MPQFKSLKEAHESHSREFQGYRWVYPVISRRAGGVSLGINLSPRKSCNFNCIYCQVDRRKPIKSGRVVLKSVLEEVRSLLRAFDNRGSCTLAQFSSVPPQARMLSDIALSGDGEPTCYRRLPDLCLALGKFRASCRIMPKLVLITNGTLLARRPVIRSLEILEKNGGEAWIKLDAGSQPHFRKMNRARFSLDRLEKNIILAARILPVKIQTMVCALKGTAPGDEELMQYIERLMGIARAGAKVEEVQLYTIARPPQSGRCTAVARSVLNHWAQTIRSRTSWKVSLY